MERLDLFNNLVALAASDRKFTEEEIAFLMVRAEDWGISQDDVEASLVLASSPEAELVIPPEREERIELMQEMIRLMAVDGELAEQEKDLCATASATMGFSIDEFNKILDSLLS
jgi:uncharacterized tellurite resistance protein B-like protein